jgi:hypothetical protein
MHRTGTLQTTLGDHTAASARAYFYFWRFS